MGWGTTTTTTTIIIIIATVLSIIILVEVTLSSNNSIKHYRNIPEGFWSMIDFQELKHFSDHIAPRQKIMMYL